MSDEFDGIFSDLVQRRGGTSKFGDAELAICRSLATLLAAGPADPATCKVLVDLERLLPSLEEAPPGAVTPLTEAELALLSDSDFEALRRVSAVLRGETPPASDPDPVVSAEEYGRVCRERDALLSDVSLYRGQAQHLEHELADLRAKLASPSDPPSEPRTNQLDRPPGVPGGGGDVVPLFGADPQWNWAGHCAATGSGGVDTNARASGVWPTPI
jgi:hypothetical protein